MGSKTYDGVRFSVYSHDHLPPHVHGVTAGIEVVIDLLPDRQIAVSARSRPVRPPDAPKNVVVRILRVAANNYDELIALWEVTHGAR